MPAQARSVAVAPPDPELVRRHEELVALLGAPGEASDKGEPYWSPEPTDFRTLVEAVLKEASASAPPLAPDHGAVPAREPAAEKNSNAKTDGDKPRNPKAGGDTGTAS